MPELRAARASSPTSRSTPAWSPPPARGSARRSPPPSGSSTAPASPTPSAGRPATTPAPTSIGGYCYLNNAAAAVQALRDGGLAPVGVLDLDLHYPNGTSALVERMGADATLHSLHASPVTNVAAGTVLPRAPRERADRLRARAPTPTPTWPRSSASLERARRRASAALVVSLGYDTVAGDPHGSWDFEPEIFAEIGRLLAAAELPVCVVQEGGYALDALAACSHAFAAGLLGEGGSDERASSRSAAGSTRSTSELARLLGERFEICREVAVHKSEHGIPMMQPEPGRDRPRPLPRSAAPRPTCRPTSPPTSSTC